MHHQDFIRQLETYSKQNGNPYKKARFMPYISLMNIVKNPWSGYLTKLNSLSSLSKMQGEIQRISNAYEKDCDSLLHTKNARDISSILRQQATSHVNQQNIQPAAGSKNRSEDSLETSEEDEEILSRQPLLERDSSTKSYGTHSQSAAQPGLQLRR